MATPAKSTVPERDPQGRKNRRPVVRALKAARSLQAQADAAVVSADAGESDPASLQPTAPDRGAEEVRPCSA
jgi:hypothetical protein